MRAMILERPGDPLHLAELPDPLAEANAALDDLLAGRFEGAAVIEVAS